MSPLRRKKKPTSRSLSRRPIPACAGLLFSVEGDDFPADNRAAAAFVGVEQQSALFLGSPADFGYLPLALSPGGDARLSGLADFIFHVRFLRRRQPRRTLLCCRGTRFCRRGADAAARLDALHQFVLKGGTVLLAPSAGAAGRAAERNRIGWAIAPESMQRLVQRPGADGA